MTKTHGAGRVPLQMLRNSERKDFKRCPQQWWWAWVMGLVKAASKFDALRFGTGVHFALEHHYIPGLVRGRDPRETWEEFVGAETARVKAQGYSEEADAIVEEWVSAKALGLAMLTGYLLHWASEDGKWEIISPEQTFAVLVKHPVTGVPFIRLVGTFDLVARDTETGELWLWDHKTAASLVLRHLPNDEQAGTYFAVAPTVLRTKGLLDARSTIKGILYNFLIKAEADDRPENAAGQKLNKPDKNDALRALVAHDLRSQGVLEPTEEDEAVSASQWSGSKWTLARLEEVAKERGVVIEGKVSKSQPAARFHREPVRRTLAEGRRQIADIGNEALIMEKMRTGELPVFKTRTKECTFCPFYDMCLVDDQGGDISDYLTIVYDRRDPYAAHAVRERELTG